MNSAATLTSRDVHSSYLRAALALLVTASACSSGPALPGADGGDASDAAADGALITDASPDSLPDLSDALSPMDAVEARPDGALACFPTSVDRQWGTPADDHALSVAVDGAGKLYIAGYEGGVMLGAVEPEGAPTAFIEKWLDGPAGTRLYRYEVRSAGAEVVDAIEARDGGRLLFAGRSAPPGDRPAYDLVVGELDSAGRLVATLKDGAARPEHPLRLAETSDGAVVVAGFSDIHIAGNHVESWEDAFVFVWRPALGLDQRSWTYHGTLGQDSFRALAVDRQRQAIYVGGSAILGPRQGASISRMGDDGAAMWTEVISAARRDEIVAMKTLADGTLLVLGNTSQKLGQQSYGGFDAFVMKVDPGSRRTVWTTQFGSSRRDYARDLAVDPAGAIHVVAEVLEATASGNNDVVVWSLTADGALSRSVERISAGDERPSAVAVGPCGEIVVVGATNGAFDRASSPHGGYDAFVTTLPPLD